MSDLEEFRFPEHPSSSNSELAMLAEQLEALTYSDERYRIAAENSSEIIMDYDLLRDSACFVTDKMELLYGVPAHLDGARDYLVRTGVVQPESEYDFLEIFQRCREGLPRAQCTVKMRTSEGEFRWCQVVLSTMFDEEGNAVRAIGVLKDITQQKEVELQYENELLYRDAMKRDALLTYEMDLTNRKVLSGLEKPFTALGISYTDDYESALELIITNLVYREDRDMLFFMMSAEHLLLEYAKGNSKIEMEYRKLQEDGSFFWVRGSVYLTDDKSAGAVKAFFYVHDINDAKMEELRLREKAERDLLTGLYNKVTTEQLVTLAIDSPLAEGRVSAFLIVDLDNFKNVNDQLGHAFGDAVLSETAQKLQTMCRSDDIAGRIGGDEFALFLKNLPDCETAERKAQKICNMFHDAYSGALRDYKISGTVGISLVPAHATSFEELYRKADLALYAAKNRGKDSYCMYSDEISGLDGTSSHAAIDRSAGKTFSDNVMEYVFRILYESQDLGRAVSGILELVTKHFGFSRGYLYEYSAERGCFSGTFEWCAPQVDSLFESLPVIRGRLLDICHARFETERLFLAEAPAALSPEERSLPVLRNVQTRVQYSLIGNGHFYGFVGFDNNASGQPIAPPKLSALQGVAQMLDVFLAEKYVSERQFRMQSILEAVANGADSCTYVIDPENYQLQFVNRNTASVIPGAQPGLRCYEALRGRSTPCADCPITHMLESGLRDYHTQLYLDPYRLWAHIDVSLVTLADGKDYGLFSGHDFTGQRDEDVIYRVEADAFTRDTTLYDALCRSTDDYIYMCDMSKNLFYLPPSMVEEFNLPGQIVEDLVPIWAAQLHPNDRDTFLHEMDDLISGRSSRHFQEYRARNRDGNWIWLRCRGYLKRDETGRPTLFAGFISNLETKSTIDFLSGLPNKYEFERRMRAALAQPEDGWLMLLGLDNFKNVNSLYGWEFGDHVIHEAAQKIQSILPGRLQVFRLDGDKFGIYSLGDEPPVEEIFSVIFSGFQAQQQYGGRRYYCTVSAGYSMFLGAGQSSFTTLFRQAEYALEYSKTEGKNRLTSYRADLMGSKDRTLTIIERLRESVDHGCADFELYFQPQVNATTRGLHGAEALLRWYCEEFGPVSPIEFIPLLEQTGLIRAVGRWVLLQAADACRAWRAIIPDFIINVNLSFVQLQDHSFLPFLAEMVEDGQIEPQALHLELTESCIASGSRPLISAFYELRKLGFFIEMDDFGTGYSSLEILKNAPADVVKIDRAFVPGVEKSEFDATFVRFVVALCHSVNIKVCLEGVETEEEYGLVKSMELDYIQGYLFGRPLPREIFEEDFLSPPHI